MKSAEDVYPIIPDDDTTFSFVEFIHNNARPSYRLQGDRGLPKSTCPLWRDRATTLTNRDQQLVSFDRTPWRKPRGRPSISFRDS